MRVAIKYGKTKKKNQLLQDAYSLPDVINVDESFDDYIDRQHLDFSFKQNLKDLTFYGSSEQYDNVYESFGKNKSFKVDKKIFLTYYNIKIELYKAKVGGKEAEIINEYTKKTNEIREYFASLGFKDNIESMGDKYYIVSDDDDNIEAVRKYNKKLKNFFNEEKEDFEKRWNEQISKARYYSVC